MTENLTPSVTIAQALAFDIEERRKKDLESKVKVSPRNQPILSDIGECERQMVYGVTHWKERKPFEPEIIARLEAGNMLEKEIIRQMQSLGYTIVLEQMPVEIRGRGNELLARGRIDGMIIYHGQNIPFEIKSMAPAIFDRIRGIEDFNRKAYLRKYIRQLQLYMYGHGKEHGLFILTNGLGAVKIVPLDLDLGECEAILQRLERVNEHLRKQTFPDRIPYNPDHCDHCQFAQICLPDVKRDEAEVLGDQELIEKLERREEIKATWKEFEDLDENIKETVKKQGIKRGFAGSFLIDVKTVETRERPAIPAGKMTRVQIKRI